jgi:RNA polymerase sigma-70 factor, ECF subfamily
MSIPAEDNTMPDAGYDLPARDASLEPPRLFMKPSDAPDNLALLLAVAQRDEAAFAELYDRMSRPMFSMILRIVRTSTEAEEILQEAFWRVWEQAPNYRPELGSPFCWIATVVRREAIDRLRANSRQLQRLQEAHISEVAGDFSPPTEPKTEATGECESAVRTALARLNVDERQAVALAFFDGLTHIEIAKALGVPMGTVKARIRSGLLKLKPTLARLHMGDFS